MTKILQNQNYGAHKRYWGKYLLIKLPYICESKEYTDLYKRTCVTFNPLKVFSWCEMHFTIFMLFPNENMGHNVSFHIIINMLHLISSMNRLQRWSLGRSFNLVNQFYKYSVNILIIWDFNAKVFCTKLVIQFQINLKLLLNFSSSNGTNFLLSHNFLVRQIQSSREVS